METQCSDEVLTAALPAQFLCLGDAGVSSALTCLGAIEPYIAVSSAACATCLTAGPYAAATWRD
jgi:hypothetical protein